MVKINGEYWEEVAQEHYEDLEDEERAFFMTEGEFIFFAKVEKVIPDSKEK